MKHRTSEHIRNLDQSRRHIGSWGSPYPSNPQKHEHIDYRSPPEYQLEPTHPSCDFGDEDGSVSKG